LYLWGVKLPLKNALRAVLVALAPALAACPSPAPPRQISPAQAAEKSLMARHDSLMAQMDQLYSLKAKLSKAAVPTADAAMMDWMHQYRAPDTTVASATRLAYFRQQQQVLNQVNRQFQATIDSATLFLKQLPPAPAPAARPSSQ
jgi:uncharacterized protein involved in copper resistance